MERGRFTPLHSAAPLPRPVGYRGSGTLVAEGLSSTAFVAETLLPTKTGEYRLRGYRHTMDGGRTYTEPAVIISGNPEGCENVAVRVHDACFTSEVLGSCKCDCRQQLELAMRYIQDRPPGMIIYLQQEGRGIGLANKIAAYALQEQGLDTVDANRALGLPDDCREYTAVRHILRDLGVRSVQLMTNNPRKLSEVSALGVKVTGRIPCVVQPGRHSLGYLEAKARRMAHLLGSLREVEDDEDADTLWSSGDEGDTSGMEEFEPAAMTRGVAAHATEELDGSYCYWNHEGEPGSAGLAVDA